MIGVAYVPTYKLPSRARCDECEGEFKDSHAIEIVGISAQLHLHLRCAEALAFAFEKDIAAATRAVMK